MGYEELLSKIERAQDTRERARPSPPAAGLRPLERTAVRPVTILLVEDNDVVSRVVKKTLELEGWRVEVCEDGGSALRELEGEGQYDLIITENELPGASGLELIRRARLLTHHRQTPIIMFSSGPHRAVALSTGADLFLNKPEGINAVGKAVAHLLAMPGEHA
jgi:CheY-like chemotaxis protein